jgi:hypothetical protein
MTKKNNETQQLSKLTDLLIDDIMAASDEEILKEAAEDYPDVREEAIRVFSLIQGVIDDSKSDKNGRLVSDTSITDDYEKKSISGPMSWERLIIPGLPAQNNVEIVDDDAGKLSSSEISNDGAKKTVRSRGANNSFKRAVLAAEIVSRWYKEATFGSVKLQKTLFLCENFLGFSEVSGNYHRHAAGPHDNRMMRSVVKQMADAKWYATGKDGYKTVFIPLDKVGNHKEYFCRYWGERENDFNCLIEKLSKLDTEKTEIIATLYAAWNDFLIDGKNPSSAEIIDEVLNNWNDSKRRIDSTRWAAALQWMSANQFVPNGSGSKTRSSAGDN